MNHRYSIESRCWINNELKSRLLTPPVFYTGGSFFMHTPKPTVLILSFLLNLTVFSVEVANLNVNSSIKAGFEFLENKATDLRFKNTVKLSSAANNQILLNGSGVTASDYNKDGFCDIYFAGIEEENKLYVNLGNFRFRNATPEALKCTDLMSTSVVFADINNDTWPDLLVGTIQSGIKIFLNNKKGDFITSNDSPAIDPESAVFGLALTDLQNDGDLDIYVSTYRNYSLRSNINLNFETVFKEGKQVIVYAIDTTTGKKITGDRFHINPNGEIFESGVSDYILLNNGQGKFESSKIKDYLIDSNTDASSYYNNYKNWGLGCIFADLNSDFNDDIFVCNDLRGGDYLFYNRGDVFLRANSKIKYISPMFSMGVDVADMNNDGYSDILIVDMLNHDLASRKLQQTHNPNIGNTENKPYKYYENNRNMLFLGDESGHFNEIAYYAGLESSNWSWCPIFMDVDLDGYQDIIVTNGFGYDLEHLDLVNSSPNKSLINASRKNSSNLSYLNANSYDISYTKNDSNIAFKNNRDLTFTDKSIEWGFNFKGISQGACLADLDNDGDEDVIINNFSLYIPENQLLAETLPQIQPSNPNAVIYRNLTGKPRIRVQLNLNTGNTHGIGATICFIQDGIKQTKQIRSGSRYCSSDQPAVTFAYNTGAKSSVIDVVLARKRYLFRNILPNHLYQVTDSDLTEGNSIPLKKKTATRKKLFSSLIGTSRIVHRPGHTDTSLFQKNINKELFINEPITSVIEPDKENRRSESVIVNTGQAPKTYSTKQKKQRVIVNQKGRIIDFFTFKHDSKMLIFELRSDNIRDQQESYLNIYTLSETTDNLAPISSFKLNGSYNCLNWGVSREKPQHINIIFGGGHLLGHYPIGGDTYSIPFNLRTRKLLTEYKQVIYGGRAVNDSAFTDLDGDGNQELVLAPEGDGIQALRFENDSYSNITAKLKLNGLVGNWNSIASGDLNGDGALDLVCGNWGSNTALNRYRQSGYKLHHERQGERTNLYETYAVGNDDMFLMNLDDFKKIHPSYGFIYKSNEDFMNQSIQSVFKRKLKSITYTEFNTCIFINRNNEFKSMELAPKVNFLPTFGIDINDYNLDGRLDIFLCQGFTASKGDTESSYNHSGLFLIQDKNGDLEPFDGKDLGIRTDLFGPRSVSSPDINNDNKPDIVIGDNGRPYAFHENIGTGTGLKLKLIGNENALAGLKARIKYSNGNLGPMFEYSPKQGFRNSKSRSIIFAHSKDVESILIDHHLGESIIPVTEDKRKYSVNF